MSELSRTGNPLEDDLGPKEILPCVDVFRHARGLR